MLEVRRRMRILQKWKQDAFSLSLFQLFQAGEKGGECGGEDGWCRGWSLLARWCLRNKV